MPNGQIVDVEMWYGRFFSIKKSHQ